MIASEMESRRAPNGDTAPARVLAGPDFITVHRAMAGTTVDPTLRIVNAPSPNANSSAGRWTLELQVESGQRFCLGLTAQSGGGVKQWKDLDRLVQWVVDQLGVHEVSVHAAHGGDGHVDGPA